MADKKVRPNMKKINNWLDNVNSQMNSLYKNTYYSDKTNLNDLDDITDKIEDNITDIINRNKDSDISGVSKIYSRMKLQDSIGDDKLQNSIKELFEENPLTSEVLNTYIGNKWIKDLDNEIDIVLKYCTKMAEALDLLLDSVLSSDSFSKEFLNLRLNSSGANKEELPIFSQRADNMIKKYDLERKIREWAKMASRYGEQYVYVVPYKKAISKLLTKAPGTRASNTMTINTLEAFNEFEKKKTINESVHMDYNPRGKNSPGITIEFDMSRTLQTCIESAQNTQRIVKEGSYSLYENMVQEANNSPGYRKTSMDNTVPSDLEIPKDFNSSSSDGFVSANQSVSSDELKVKGCIVKRLDRGNLIPLYVDDDVCLGYYYVECNKELGFDFYTSMGDRYGDGNVTQGIESTSKMANDMLNRGQMDQLMQSIAGKISLQLDKKFINANQDLTKEIHAILKYNDVFNQKHSSHVRISFLPEEDVHRLAYNIDSDTNRGISDCAQGLIPAKLYSCMYITNSIGILTRGQDKRVYYVKQTVESNISQTLLNVIDQIKKSNFGIRQIENLNNILNITGRFNDFVIPVGQSGDSPVQFEVMPGQQFEINSELYNMLEEMAVNSTGVPIELVQSRNSPDFATQFTSSSLKILRFVFGRQGTVENFLGGERGILTKIYNCEYEDTQILDCELPPPLFMNMTNNYQLIQNTKEYVTALAEMEYDGETGDTIEQEKLLFIRKMMRSMLTTYIKFDTVDKIKHSVKLELDKQENEV